MGRSKSKQIQIRFLQDRPADQDFFGTHSGLAKAVASALASNPELRTIGLLGKWGSGKSTVLRELDRAITSSTDLSDIQTFTFDAWEHQGEPIRRSFLESLFSFLTERKLIEAKDWEADIDLLSGRLGVTENIETPELTPPAKQILWSLTLVPFGLSLFGLDTLQDGLGRTTTTAGEIALYISLVCFVVPLVFILESLFTARSAHGMSNNDEVIGLIVNKKVSRVKTRTIKSPEPTAIEFANTCESLIAEVKKRKQRLLCVIDNLDRLPADDALDMWAAIRAIFANVQIGGADQSHPFVLVPMDHSALSASFGGNEKDERAKSFIDKTFDLTFRVPPPVRSDWKAFLRSQMEAVFGKDAIEDRTMYFVERVFDTRHGTANEFPTPRIINRFVNSVAATWLARRSEDFSLAVVSLFVSYLEDIDTAVLDFAQREDIRFFDDDFPEWRDQIAALYFGVPEEKSRQVLLEGPLRQAIDDSDVARFKALMKYPGAFKVFHDTITGFAYDPATSDSQNFIFRCAAMLETVRDHAEATKRSWDYLLNRIVESSPPPSLESFSQSLGPFLRNLQGRQLARLNPIAAEWLSHLASSTNDEESIDAVARAYDELKRSNALGKTPSIALRGEPLAVINSVYWINGNEVLDGSTRVEVEFSKLAEDLAKLVEDENEAMTVHEVLGFRRNHPKAFPSETAVTLASIRDASTAIVGNEGVSELTKWAALNLGVMAPITNKSGETIDAFIDAGHVQARLTEAVDEGEFDIASVLVALAIARGKPFVVELDATEPLRILKPMIEALDEFVESPLNLIWNAQAAGSSPGFMEKALHHTVHHRMLSNTELDQIAGNTEFYFSPLSKADRRTLAKKIGRDEKRIDRIGKLAPSSMLLDILSPLISLGLSDAKEQCKTSVQNLPPESWQTYFEGQADWISGLVEKCSADFKLTINSGAVSAAIAFIDERSAGLNPSERARIRRLMPRFNAHAERKIIEAILPHGLSYPKSALGMMKALASETTDFITDHATAEQLFTFVGGVSVITAGRTWLEGETGTLQKAFNRVARKSKTEIREWLATTKAATPRVRGNWIEMMEHRLGLDK